MFFTHVEITKNKHQNDILSNQNGKHEQEKNNDDQNGNV